MSTKSTLTSADEDFVLNIDTNGVTEGDVLAFARKEIVRVVNDLIRIGDPTNAKYDHKRTDCVELRKALTAENRKDPADRTPVNLVLRNYTPGKRFASDPLELLKEQVNAEMPDGTLEEKTARFQQLVMERVSF
jgi:hypothetical protein